MTPTQLRSWIQKYGNRGLLLVTAYFGVAYFWRRRHFILFTAFLLFGLVALLFSAHTTTHHDARQRASSSRPLPSSPPKASKSPSENDTLQETIYATENNNRWRIERWEPREGSAADQSVRFFCKDRLVQTIHADEIGGRSIEFGKPVFPTPFPLVALRPEPEAGQPTSLSLYTLKQGRLISMGSIDGGENGGPVFRDYDGDGRPEWVFDDYCWYRYYGNVPKYYLVYKESKTGKLKLWKRERNPNHRPLPSRLGLGPWDN